MSLNRQISAVLLALALGLMILGPLIQFRPGLPLACPEWPLCFPAADYISPVKGLIEQLHRILATLLGLGTLILAYRIFSNRDLQENKPLRKAIAYSAFFIVLQGILGALTVYYRLPMVISTLHMFFSLVYLYLLLKVAFELEVLTGPWFELDWTRLTWQANWRDALWIVSTLVFCLILLGSFVRHTGSLTLCGTGLESLWSCSALWSPETSSRLQMHFLFRFVALLTFGAITAVCLSAFLSVKKILKPYALWMTLALIQFLSGMVVLVSHISMTASVFYLCFSLLTLLQGWSLALNYSKNQGRVEPQKRHTLASDLFELTKPRLTALVMVTALVGMVLAPERISFVTGAASLVLICMVVMGACGLNCYFELEVDKQMERTRERGLPAGRLSPKTALLFSSGLLVISIPLLAAFVNGLTAGLAILAAVLYVWAYTPLKRQSELALYVGAIPGAMPPVMGWTSATNQIDLMAIALFLIMFIWQIPHFMAISVFHAADYQSAGIKVYPNRYGFSFVKHSIFVYTLILLLSSLLPVWWSGASMEYFYSALLFSLSFLALAAKGYSLPSQNEARRIWARRYFLGSLFYLPLIMGSMIVFR